MADYTRDRDFALAEADERRVAAARHPGRWRVGQSPGSGGRNIYQGIHQRGRMDDPETAIYVVSVLNAVAELGRDLAAGVQLDAERSPVAAYVFKIGTPDEMVMDPRDITIMRGMSPAPTAGDALDAERRGETDPLCPAHARPRCPQCSRNGGKPDCDHCGYGIGGYAYHWDTCPNRDPSPITPEG